MRLAYATVLMVVALLPAQAWDWDTHRFLADWICDHYSCGCYSEIEDGSVTPDRDFKDFSSHSCYDPSTCTLSSYYSCPTKNDCPAMEKADEWMKKAANAKSCERWKYVGIASHYFFDSKCKWHQVMNEDYKGCHKPFEDSVGDKIKRLGLSGWSVCKCDVCVSGKDFENWLQEFFKFADSYFEDAKPTTAIPTTTAPASQTQTPSSAETPPAVTTISKPATTPWIKDRTRIPGFEVAAAASAIATAALIRRKTI